MRTTGYYSVTIDRKKTIAYYDDAEDKWVVDGVYCNEDEFEKIGVMI